jgi:tRNA(Ile2) C34 agmatinyltransferase TiaS
LAGRAMTVGTVVWARLKAAVAVLVAGLRRREEGRGVTGLGAGMLRASPSCCFCAIDDEEEEEEGKEEGSSWTGTLGSRSDSARWRLEGVEGGSGLRPPSSSSS